MRRKVLVVDDHADIRTLMGDYLRAGGFEVVGAGDGCEALKVVSAEKVDLIVLDLTMPGYDGFEVCRRIRKTSSVPILVVSARDEDLDKILVLELGADDYLTKPFNPRELVARVQATFRRVDWDREERDGTRLDHGPLCLDKGKRQAWVDGQTLPLTPIEFSLLWCLLSQAGQNMSRQQLLDKVWGADYCGDERTVDAHIRSLRQKLRKADDRLRPIRSVWGVGYRFEA